MSKDYDVGYGKPPKRNQFPKGQSGNPKGRPKGTKNLKTDLEEVLQEKVVIIEGDGRKVVSMQRGILMALANKGIKGDTKAAIDFCGLAIRLLDQGESGSEEEPLGDDDLAILEAFKKREVESAQPAKDQPGGDDDVGNDAGDEPPENGSNHE